MKMLRFTVVLVALAIFAALPASAQSIPPGPDRWVTPNDGQTFVVIPKGELEALCGRPSDDSWDHQVPMVGIPTDGADWDTAVYRLDKAAFVNGIANTRIQVRALNFKGLETRDTPCGTNSFSAHLSGDQPVTQMTLRKTHSNGGIFFADIHVKTEVRVYDANSGALLGSIPFDAKLPSPASGTPYTYTGGVFKPGIDSSSGPESCVPALRAKQSQYPVGSRHYYFIEDLIAQGKCTKRG